MDNGSLVAYELISDKYLPYVVHRSSSRHTLSIYLLQDRRHWHFSYLIQYPVTAAATVHSHVVRQAIYVTSSAGIPHFTPVPEVITDNCGQWHQQHQQYVFRSYGLMQAVWVWHVSAMVYTNLFLAFRVTLSSCLEMGADLLKYVYVIVHNI